MSIARLPRRLERLYFELAEPISIRHARLISEAWRSGSHRATVEAQDARQRELDALALTLTKEWEGKPLPSERAEQLRLRLEAHAQA